MGSNSAISHLSQSPQPLAPSSFNVEGEKRKNIAIAPFLHIVERRLGWSLSLSNVREAKRIMRECVTRNLFENEIMNYYANKRE
jgi:hypothetical protein